MLKEIIAHPPSDWNFTAFRYPPVSSCWTSTPSWNEKSQYYMVLGCGINVVGPRMPLYSANATDLTEWKFLKTLFEIPDNNSSTGTSVSTSKYQWYSHFK